LLQTITPTDNQWDAFVEAHPQASILQTTNWGALKSAFGWSAGRVAVGGADGEITAGALVLYRRLPLRLGTIAYVPRGPLVDWSRPDVIRSLLAALDADARRRRAVFLKVEPPLDDTPEHAECLERLGFRHSAQTVQPPRTVLIDIGGDEDAILAAMKQKTRYNIRLSARKGVQVQQTDRSGLEAFNHIVQVTGERNAFGVHTPAYYAALFDHFAPSGQMALFIASYEGEALAAVMVFALGQTAWYLHGASSNKHRNLMPTYAVQWEAIRWARARGCTVYDLWGVPDADEATLEADFQKRSDGLWGVYRFKRGFGGRLARTVGAWDRVYNPLLYGVYRRVVQWRARATSTYVENSNGNE
jgi:lipid II:glycine glycyltransferase (peptidoglycan interpeptide bridge formation enzyme)